MAIVTENWTESLRSMQVGETKVFPTIVKPTIDSIISRLRVQYCTERRNWKRVGPIDRDKGEFRVRRIS